MESIPDPFFVIGDAGYASLPHLTVPFRGELDRDLEIFNKRHSFQRMCVEITIGFIKSRFRRFRAPSKMVNKLRS
jgi:hypothetical protein